MRKESGDPQRVLSDVMGLLADGTIVPDAGAQLPCLCRQGASITAVRLSRHKTDAVMQRFGAGQSLPALATQLRFAHVAGQKFSITDIEEVKKGIRESQGSGRKGKYLIEG